MIIRRKPIGFESLRKPQSLGTSLLRSGIQRMKALTVQNLPASTEPLEWNADESYDMDDNATAEFDDPADGLSEQDALNSAIARAEAPDPSASAVRRSPSKRGAVQRRPQKTAPASQPRQTVQREPAVPPVESSGIFRRQQLTEGDTMPRDLSAIMNMHRNRAENPSPEPAGPSALSESSIFAPSEPSKPAAKATPVQRQIAEPATFSDDAPPRPRRRGMVVDVTPPKKGLPLAIDDDGNSIPDTSSSPLGAPVERGASGIATSVLNTAPVQRAPREDAAPNVSDNVDYVDSGATVLDMSTDAIQAAIRAAEGPTRPPADTGGEPDNTGIESAGPDFLAPSAAARSTPAVQRTFADEEPSADDITPVSDSYQDAMNAAIARAEGPTEPGSGPDVPASPKVSPASAASNTVQPTRRTETPSRSDQPASGEPTRRAASNMVQPARQPENMPRTDAVIPDTQSGEPPRRVSSSMVQPVRQPDSPMYSESVDRTTDALSGEPSSHTASNTVQPARQTGNTQHADTASSRSTHRVSSTVQPARHADVQRATEPELADEDDFVQRAPADSIQHSPAEDIGTGDAYQDALNAAIARAEGPTPITDNGTVEADNTPDNPLPAPVAPTRGTVQPTRQPVSMPPASDVEDVLPEEPGDIDNPASPAASSVSPAPPAQASTSAAPIQRDYRGPEASAASETADTVQRYPTGYESADDYQDAINAAIRRAEAPTIPDSPDSTPTRRTTQSAQPAQPGTVQPKRAEPGVAKTQIQRQTRPNAPHVEDRSAAAQPYGNDSETVETSAEIPTVSPTRAPAVAPVQRDYSPESLSESTADASVQRYPAHEAAEETYQDAVNAAIAHAEAPAEPSASPASGRAGRAERVQRAFRTGMVQRRVPSLPTDARQQDRPAVAPSTPASSRVQRSPAKSRAMPRRPTDDERGVFLSGEVMDEAPSLNDDAFGSAETDFSSNMMDLAAALGFTSGDSAPGVQRSVDDDVLDSPSATEGELLSMLGLPSDTPVRRSASQTQSPEASSAPRNTVQPGSVVQRSPVPAVQAAEQTTDTSEPDSGAGNDRSQQIEKMAQAVYQLLKERLRVERERLQGRR